MPPPLHCVGRVCVFSHAGLTWISCAGLRWTSCLVCTSAWSVCPGFMPCCVWSGCVVSHFFRKRGHAPACCGGLGCVCIDGLGRVVFAPEAGRAYVHGEEVGGRLRTSSSVLNLGRTFFSLGKKPKHTILCKEKCRLCARTTLLLPVCRRERAADRCFNGTLFGPLHIGLAYLPSLAPFQRSQSTKSEYERQKGQDRSSPLHPVFTSPTRTPTFCVLLCYPLLCDPGWFY